MLCYFDPNLNIQNDAVILNHTDQHRSKDPLHGMTLENILKHLVHCFGWEELGIRINIRCFNYDPSIKSSLTFLRKTPWARKKVENLYIDSLK